MPQGNYKMTCKSRPQGWRRRWIVNVLWTPIRELLTHVSSCEDGGGHPADASPVPVSVAQRGLGSAGSVPIPLEVWQSPIHQDSLQAMASVQIPQPRLAPAVSAMTTALV